MYGISWELSDRRDIGKIFAVLYSFSPCNSVWHVDDVDRLDKMYDDLENRIFSFQAAKELLHAVEDVISIATWNDQNVFDAVNNVALSDVMTYLAETYTPIFHDHPEHGVYYADYEW